MARSKEKLETVTATPPGEGWMLLAKASFKAGGWQFFPGCRVEPKVLGRNHAAFFANHSVAWCPPGTEVTAHPRELPKVDKPKPMPKPQIVEADDVVDSWELGVLATLSKF